MRLITASFKMVPRSESSLVIGKPVTYKKKKVGEIINFQVEDERVLVTVRLDTEHKLLLSQLVKELPTHINVETGTIMIPERKAE